MSAWTNSFRRFHSPWWWFVPLGLFFAAMALLVYDVRHPQIAVTHECTVLAAGHKAAAYKTGTNLLYSHGSSALNDLAFRCPRLGTVVINEFEVARHGVILPLAKASLRHRRYHFLPEQWRLSVSMPHSKATSSASLP
ncbi:MAG: hypothetical protein SFZ03_05385 [Candidatus Melainabacteria bacterium]|nr:hypothetical protein [Candidatus Melainabacteria bacterium]